MNSGYFTVGKGGSVKARRLMRVFVEPQADRVLRLQVRALLVLDSPSLLNHIAGMIDFEILVCLARLI